MSFLSVILANYAAALVFWTVFLALSAFEYRQPLLQPRVDRGRRWPVNLTFSMLQIAIAAVLPVSSTVAAYWCEANGIGLLNALHTPFSVNAVVTVAVYSLAFYAIHYLSHVLPLLWRMHSVHHTDHFVDASTTLRLHPLETAFNVLCSCLLVVIFGFSPVVLIAYYAIESAIAVFSHSRMHLSAALERKLAAFLVTPTIHHIHHSSHQPETDSNFGGLFTVWDRLFGTFRSEARGGNGVANYGLEDVSPEEAGSLDAQLMRPFTMRTSAHPQRSAISDHGAD